MLKSRGAEEYDVEGHQDQPVRQFESLMEELQATVTLLESDGLSLEEAIASYERAVTIAAQCSRMLDEAEMRVALIDTSSRELREDVSIYSSAPTDQAERFDVARLLLGDDEEELCDLLDDDE